MKVNFGRCGSKKCCVRATFDVGSNVEYNSIYPYGIAHLVEHNIFLGAKDLHPDDFNKQIATLGFSVNAGTYQNRVTFFVEGPAENSIEASKLLKKVLFDGDFKEDLFEKEKLVVLEEERGGRDDIDNCVGEKLNEFICSGPYSVPIIGTEESIKSITLQQVKDFHRFYYRPERLLLTVAGPENLDVDAIISIFGENDGRFIKSRKQKSKYKNEKELIVRDDRIQQAKLFISYKAFPILDNDALVLNYLGKFFAEDMDSRLFCKLRQEYGLCYAVGAYSAFYQELGFYILYIYTAENKIEDAKVLLDLEIQKLLDGEISDEEMIRAKNKFKSEIFGIVETSYGIASVINTRAFYGLPELEVTLDRIENMTKEDIMKACHRVFKEKNKQTFIYLPGEKVLEKTYEEEEE